MRYRTCRYSIVELYLTQLNMLASLAIAKTFWCQSSGSIGCHMECRKNNYAHASLGDDVITNTGLTVELQLPGHILLALAAV